MPIVFMSEMVLNYPFSMVESYSSSLLLIYGQIMNRKNSTGLGHISILSDLSSTRDYRMLLCMILQILSQTSSFFTITANPKWSDIVNVERYLTINYIKIM